MSSTATVIGGFGFVGAALSAYLAATGRSVTRIGRDDAIPAAAGDIFYCAGLTADFRTRPFDTIDAHVTLINRLVRDNAFDSLVYLSSTRVYQGSTSGSETAAITVQPDDPGDLYNLSKLTGEVICLRDPRCRVVRLSNVFGPGDGGTNFLGAVVGEATATGTVHIGSGRGSAKDYIGLADAVAAIALIPARAESRVINVAGGSQVTNAEIGAAITAGLGAAVSYADDTADYSFPPIDNARMRRELGIAPRPFASTFSEYLAAAR